MIFQQLNRFFLFGGGWEGQERTAWRKKDVGPQGNRQKTGSLMAKQRHDVPASRKRAPDDDRPSPREVFQNGSLNGRHRDRPQKPGEPPAVFLLPFRANNGGRPSQAPPTEEEAENPLRIACPCASDPRFLSGFSSVRFPSMAVRQKKFPPPEKPEKGTTFCHDLIFIFSSIRLATSFARSTTRQE